MPEVSVTHVEEASRVNMTVSIGEEQRTAWQRDGVICIRGVLSKATLDEASRVFAWSRENPGPNAFTKVIEGGELFQDRANPDGLTAYGTLARQPEFRKVLSELWGNGEVWFLFEQIFSRLNAALPPTPWHQDTLYMPTRGSQLATIWFSLQPIPHGSALEFIPGSHLGPLYNGIKSHPDEGTMPLYDRDDMPPLPDMDTMRDEWPFVRWATEPADLLVFHPSVLHGGGSNAADVTRQTVTLRYFGEDARVSDLPDADVYRASGEGDAAVVHPLSEMYRKRPGDFFRHDRFPRI